jgi:hypothetical protein
MVLNYWMMVERYPNLKEEVGSSILGWEISILLDGKLVRWSTISSALTVSCALTLTSWPLVQKEREKEVAGRVSHE